jgi:pimeloyl-ACP methyl ester carboxylesterase
MLELPLILVPGLLNTARLWEAQATALGRDRPVTVFEAFVANSLGVLADGLLAGAPATFALGGLSMGGYLAFEVWRRAPERVARLALFDTTARPDAPEQTERRLALVQLARGEGLDAVLPKLVPALFAMQHANDANMVRMVTGMAHEVGVEGFANQQQAILSRPDSRPDLGNIACPTLVVVGEDDQLTPPEVAAEIATAIPGATLVRIPDSGHLSPIEAPELVTQALHDWLA